MSGTGFNAPAPPGAPSHAGTPRPMGPGLPPGPQPPAPPQPPFSARRGGGGARPAVGPPRGARPPGGTSPAGLPERRLVVGSLLGAVIGGSLLGLVIGVLAPGEAPEPKVNLSALTASSPSAAQTGAPPAASPPATPGAGASASPSESAQPKTVTRTAEGPPNAHIDRPTADKNMQFLILEDIWREGDRLVVRGQPARLLSGSKAKTFYESKQEQPRALAAQPTGAPSIEFRVQADATFFGEHFIGYSDHQERRQMGRDEFHDQAKEALQGGQHPTLWLKRSLGVEGPVIYVAEQYLG